MRDLQWPKVCLALALVACGNDSVPRVSVGPTGARRLSRNEYDNTVRDLLLDESRSGFAKLPEDVLDPFDNDFTTQQPSGILVDAAETLAFEASARLMADPAKRDQVIGCVPTGADDTACLRSFVMTFGRRALRRPLTPQEVEQYVAFSSLSVEGNDFYVGAGMVIAALLQDPEFLYRIERGEPVKGRTGLYRLDDYEVGTRLSYFIWGSTPDDELLDTASKGALRTPEQVRAAAERLLADPRARARIDRFHAMWLGYYKLPHSADLVASMRTETQKLIERVVFEEGRPWADLFTSNETYIDANLAQLYGMPTPSGGAGWATYSGPGNRAGLLSTGAFLSVAGKFGDTSPTQRGRLIRERLMCQVVPPPPPNVDVDKPPTSTTMSTCKVDRYASHRSDGACYGCHNQMDPVGFGLENFDQTGAWRTTDKDDASCVISGDGQLYGLGDEPVTFNGPAQLESVLIDSGVLENCLVTQLYRFAVGHREQRDDAQVIDALATEFTQTRKLDELMLDLVSADAFGYRQEEK
ncbi:MAG TPA: DUF1592 domain-containing protein [Kofleriaceae bacterium]|nr:DUF1592 domain-containing protein [Kofleriaceae bacterium]